MFSLAPPNLLLGSKVSEVQQLKQKQRLKQISGRNWTAHQILQKQVSLAEKRLQSNRAVGAVGYLDLERADSGLRRDHMLCKRLHRGDAARAGVVEGREGSKDFVNIISMHLILT